MGDGDGYLHLLSQVDGSQAGRYKMGYGAIKAQPVVDGDLIFVLSADGQLMALQEKAPAKKTLQ